MTRLGSRLAAAIAVIPPILLSLSCSTDGPVDVGAGAESVKRWTVMLYDDADFPGYDPFRHFCEQAYSGEHLNVLVLQDTLGGPAKLYYVDESHTAVVLDEPGEINMGDPETLRGFIQNAKRDYPAKHYALAFYNHGGGWRGTCWDRTSDDDNLTMDEVCQALTDAGGVDVILFSAPCLMGAVESVYELRECTRFYLAAEDLSGYCWWVYAMGDMCEALNGDRPIGAEALARLIIDSIWEHRWSSCPSLWGEQVQMAAIRTEGFDRFASAFDSLSLEYLRDMSHFRFHMGLMFDSLDVLYYQHVDIRQFVTELRRVAFNPAIRRAIDRIKQYQQEAVIHQCRGRVTAKQCGLNIYFPEPYLVPYDSTYGDPDTRLDFAEDTHWDELLDAYFQGIGTGGPCVSVPPLSDGFQPE